ncbi:MAG: pentapeptide repeat-containing protein [Chloroflexi bacterium]|nr:MAG: pentapeptide repeat-containing protein [Chloroflexota bacterium]MBL1193413.1 pentapeptide repeat-containing protein [Chloroflexota bacterium]NOH10705.1 pentapeptide repeat-containing protein [Chloroflexota bacterium]
MFDQQFYEDQQFKDLVIENEIIEDVDFQDCSFTKCTFTETSFRACKFRGCSFSDCDLSLVRVDHSAFKGVTFENCRVIGINWPTASWGSKEDFVLVKPIVFFKCVLNYSSFVGLELEGLRLEKCIAKEVDFSEANLSQANFQHTDFLESSFRNTDLTEADFVDAKNYMIDPSTNTIKKARFSIPEAMALLYSMDIEIIE